MSLCVLKYKHIKNNNEKMEVKTLGRLRQNAKLPKCHFSFFDKKDIFLAFASSLDNKYYI